MTLLVRAVALGIALANGLPLYAQNRSGAASPRRQFLTISIDRMRTMPLHFKEWPLEQLTGTELTNARLPDAEYRSEDGRTIVDVRRFRRATRGAGLMVYPFGATRGATLALRVSYEELPIIHVVIDRAGEIERYDLADGRAYDFGFGVYLGDRPRGWSLGAHSFLIAGIGKLSGERGDGRRYFVESGGGVSVGPLGLQVSVKLAHNRLKDPRPHTFFTVPIALRGTVSF